MRIGLVIKVIPEKNIGFIRAEDLREDVFFHFSKVEQVGRLDLRDGDEVEFEIDELDKIEPNYFYQEDFRKSAPLEQDMDNVFGANRVRHTLVPRLSDESKLKWTY